MNAIVTVIGRDRVGIIRGVLFLALALRTEWLCGRAWKEAWKKWRKDG